MKHEELNVFRLKEKFIRMSFVTPTGGRHLTGHVPTPPLANMSGLLPNGARYLTLIVLNRIIMNNNLAIYLFVVLVRLRCWNSEPVGVLWYNG